MNPSTNNAENRASILKSVSIFSTLGTAEIGELAAASSILTFSADEFVFLEGNAAEHFFVLAEGQVKVVKHSPSGKDFVVAFFNAGEMFGEVAVFEDKPYPASAQANSQIKVLAIPARAFVDFLAQRPRVALKIIDVLGARLTRGPGPTEEHGHGKGGATFGGCYRHAVSKTGALSSFYEAGTRGDDRDDD